MNLFSDPVMARRHAMVMLYRSFSDGGSVHPAGAWTKDAFGPEIVQMIAEGYAVEAFGGYMITEAGVKYWENSPASSIALRRRKISEVQVEILIALLDGEWHDAATLPGYIAQSGWSNETRARLWDKGNGLVDKKKGTHGKRILFRLNEKGRTYLRTEHKIDNAVSEGEPANA